MRASGRCQCPWIAATAPPLWAHSTSGAGRAATGNAGPCIAQAACAGGLSLLPTHSRVRTCTHTHSHLWKCWPLHCTSCLRWWVAFDTHTLKPAHVHTHTHTHTYTHTSGNAGPCIAQAACAGGLSLIPTHSCVRTCTHTHIHTHTHFWKCWPLHCTSCLRWWVVFHTHTLTHAHVHTHTHSHLWKCWPLHCTSCLR